MNRKIGLAVSLFTAFMLTSTLSALAQSSRHHLPPPDNYACMRITVTCFALPPHEERAEPVITHVEDDGRHDSNVPPNAFDGTLATRWSADSDNPQTARILIGHFDRPYTIDRVHVDVFQSQGGPRQNRFIIDVCNETDQCTTVVNTQSGSEIFHFDPVPGVVKIVYYGYGSYRGNDTDGYHEWYQWNSVSELTAFGFTSEPRVSKGSISFFGGEYTSCESGQQDGVASDLFYVNVAQFNNLIYHSLHGKVEFRPEIIPARECHH